MLGQTETRVSSPFFELQRPVRQAPVLVEVPHSGLAVPERVRPQMRAPLDGIMRDADIYVDKLYADAPAHGTVPSAHARRRPRHS